MSGDDEDADADIADDTVGDNEGVFLSRYEAALSLPTATVTAEPGLVETVVCPLPHKARARNPAAVSSACSMVADKMATCGKASGGGVKRTIQTPGSTRSAAPTWPVETAMSGAATSRGTFLFRWRKPCAAPRGPSHSK